MKSANHKEKKQKGTLIVLEDMLQKERKLKFNN